MDDCDILIVEDTADLAELYKNILEQKGYNVTIAHSGRALFKILQEDTFEPSLLILDVKLPDMSGIEILSHLKKQRFNAPVIVMTGHGSINMAVEAMQAGADDFLVKPFQPEKLLCSVARAMQGAGLSTKAKINSSENKKEIYDEPLEEPSTHIKPADLKPSFGGFIGTSPSMRLVYEVIQSAAKSNASVFITGESGTGKELCAQSIHRLSRRSAKPFIAINCAAIPRDLLESELFGHVKGAFTSSISNRDGAVTMAQGGTLFLDEIAEMAPDMQTKLLRFLQDLTYQKVGGNKQESADVRILCATNKDPLKEIDAGRLRQDLYYRLHVIPIEMPPLRARPSDIIDLAHYFLKIYAREERKRFGGFSLEAERILTQSSWDGNVRELQNVVRRITVLYDGENVTAPMMPKDLIQQSKLFWSKADMPSFISDLTKGQSKEISPLWRIEQFAIEDAIHQCKGNIPQAAALLEISPSTIYRKKLQWDKYQEL